MRTPDERFQSLPDFPYQPHYIEVNRLRMHYVREGAGDPILCLHGEPTWAYLYRKMIPTLAQVGCVIAPDLIGFGRSDKLPCREDYSVALHAKQVTDFITQLNLWNVTLVCQDWGGLLGLPMVAEMPDRFARVVVMNTFIPTGDEQPSDGFLRWRGFAAKQTDMDIGFVVQSGCVSKLSPEVIAAYNAPFPEASYKAGAHQFPLLVPITPDDPASEWMRKGRTFFSTWTRPALVMFSDSDPVTRGGEKFFRRLIPSAQNEPEIMIAQAGHFLQEDKGEEIAEQIKQFIERRPI
ncbi:MAG: haloalkane dehalogenase [Blastocatellia bacterium]|nr:haloalkane dehalogenase [Blastocatellia bacterium]